jgi:iron complex transport system substrate-binding protein
MTQASFARLSIAIVALVLSVVPVPGSPERENGGAIAGFPREVTLPDGKTITIPEKPVRICSVTVASDEILWELVSPERLIALSYLVDNPTYSNIVTEATAVSHRVTSDAEHLIGLNPDLVLVAFYSRAEFVKLLEEADLPVVRLEEFDNLDDIRKNIRLLGTLTGTESRAEDLILAMDQRIERVRSLVAGRSRPMVLPFVYGWVAGEGTIYHDIVELAGGRCLSGEKGIKGHKQVSVESLLAWDPEYILTDGPQARLTSGEKLKTQNPILGNLRALRENRVIEIPSAHLFSCASHHIVKGIEELARLLHPEAFSEVGGESIPSATSPE